MTEPILDYLADLDRTLRRVGRGRPDILAEVEDHLREAAELGHASGMSVEAAQRQAVAAFGEPAMLAARLTTAPTATRALITAITAVGVLSVVAFAVGLQAQLLADDTRSGISLGWSQRLEEHPKEVPMGE